MTLDTAAAQRTMGIIVELENGRTIEDTDKGPVVIWNACMIAVGTFDRNGDTGYVVDVITMLDTGTVIRGLIVMARELVGAQFLGWCSQHGLPQPDSKVVRKIANGLTSDPESRTPVTYIDNIGEVEPGLWALTNGIMVDGEFIPMERGAQRQTKTGRRIVYAPSINCEESCGPEPLSETDGEGVANWASAMIDTFGSISPLICAAWVRASVYRSRIEQMDAQIPALYICGDSHRGKTLMSTVSLRMLGAKGERPHANMTSSTNAGVFLVAALRSSLPFVMDEVKPYSGVNDNDLVKSLVNGDIPAKSTRGGRLRSATRVKSMPILVSEFVPGDTSSITNRVFTMNLVTLHGMAKTSLIPDWVWWSDKNRDLYSRWSHSIYSKASVETEDNFVSMWRGLNADATTICDDACMTLNRSVTSTTIALLGFRLLDEDSGGRLSALYPDFCNALSTCLREMSRLVADVSPILRYITAIKSGWAGMEGRYSSLVSDRVFTYSEKYGLIVDHHTLHGLIIDSRRVELSRLGNAATLGMVLVGEGFKMINDDKVFNGRYRIPLPSMFKKPWAYDLTRLITLMGCTAGQFLSNSLDNE